MSYTILGHKKNYYRSRFVLTIDYVHGGEESETSHFTFDLANVEKLEKAVQVLRYAKEHKVTKFCEMKHFGVKMFSDYMLSDKFDCSTDQTYAVVVFVDVTWYDENGVAFDVEII